MARRGRRLSVSLLLSHLFSSFMLSSSCSPALITHGTSHALRLRGGSSQAAQLAEIRAMRAKQYEMAKKVEMEQDAQKAEKQASYSGAQRVWYFATEEVGPNTIATQSQRMMQGDARRFYEGQKVTMCRNRETGMVIELMHDSDGWFQYSARENSALAQINAAGNIFEYLRWYSPGLLEQIKKNPLKSDLLDREQRMGGWKASPHGSSILIKHAENADFELYLLEQAFLYINRKGKEAIFMDTSGEPHYMSISNAEAMLKR
ncbi:hypothetical protein GUITHDRAFT_166414 [Guillardia theta CCMP2712]|uniref:Uncharacterized protein n=2 Tax=Guillardia theta TaxID=55529 RepID=L1IBH0_GUITC|nr:hypothetical protein GUITHDRAFT_166414 [Guillardia theta CCMP2712]EKX33578.1 hypothetical protein GUITHDRAFT_166414 [Guillardia theta CCMP2712]|eukprot:XP_005820558.1 hypothetical protein GUITHDRAFT_166414 [Guillardia theta CCMP2712]